MDVPDTRSPSNSITSSVSPSTSVSFANTSTTMPPALLVVVVTDEVLASEPASVSSVTVFKRKPATFAVRVISPFGVPAAAVANPDIVASALIALRSPVRTSASVASPSTVNVTVVPLTITLKVSPTSTAPAMVIVSTCATAASSLAVAAKSGRASGESLTALTVMLTVAELKAGVGPKLLETV